MAAESHTATILVTDLVGSTEARVRLGEEGADALRRAHDELLRSAVENTNGHVVKGLGDGVLAMFDSASDAVAAAVAIQQGAYAHNHHVPDQPLDIRVGISAGDVAIEDGDCFGTPVVEASRLCSAAVGAQILAAELVRLLARGRGGHVFTAAGERELKGLPEPVPVVSVGWDPPELAAVAVPFPPRLTPQGAFPFSGRAAQFEALLHAWKQVSAGDRRVVLLSGEPGIGKTRLASEVARHAHDEGAVVLFGRCDEDMGVPFQPFVDALEHVVQSGDAATVERLGRHANELVRLVPDVARLVPGLESPLQSDPETERYRLFDAVAAWLGAMSNPAGVLLVLDDLHWAEKPTLLLLRHLIRCSEPMRLLVVGTYRDTDLDRAHPLADVLADLRREPGVERLALTGLDVEGITELLASAAGERMDERASELAQVLWSETEGNPFFVQEILRSLVESGRIVQRDGVWTTDLDVADLGIPEGVREVIGRRLTRLSDQANSVLGMASVVGAVVDVDLLVAISGMSDDAVLDALDEAAAASLLKETSASAYEFTHALVRSTLYDELSAARRARRHRQVAEALEERGDKDRDVAALAHHFGRAGMVDGRAVEYARAAGEMAVDRLAFDQAVAFYVQALEAADDTEVDDAARCALLIALGTAQRLAGMPAFRDTLIDAAALAERIGDADLLAQAALANTRGFWSTTGVVDDERLRMLQAALDAVGPGDSELRARLLAVQGVEMVWRDPELRRLEVNDEALAIAHRLGDEPTLLHVMTIRHLSSSVAHRVPDMVAEAPDVIALAERLGDAHSLMLAASWGFAHNLETGNAAEARRLVGRLQQVAAELPTPMFRWLAAVYRCCITMLSGTGDEIEEQAVTALQLGQDGGQEDAFIWFAPQLFTARLAQGRVGEILDVVRQQTDDNPGLPGWAAALAVVLARTGEREESATVVERLLAAGPGVFPYDRVWLLGHSLLGEAVAAVGTPEQAAQQSEVLAPYADRLPCIATSVRPTVALHLAMLAARAGRPNDAERHFAAADATHARVEAHVWLAETRLHWGRFLLERGDADRARTKLADARTLADRMGAADISAAAETLLA